MTEATVLHDDTPPAPAHEPRPLPEPSPLLARLNRRGFRLVMLADAMALAAVAVGSMIVRFGLDWPNYSRSLYLVSFSVSVAIFLASLYFGGLYEREPRLGAPAVLPRVARQTLAAGGLVALLTLALTGLAREVGWTTERVLPLPIINLLVLISVGASVVAANRALAAWLRTRREGPPRVVLLGEAARLATARAHLDEVEHATIVAELDRPDGLVEAVAETRATDLLVLTGDWLERLYPWPLDALERSGLTVLLRVSARETMFGLERIRQIGGLPFVLLRSQTMAPSRAKFKRLFDVVVLAVSVPVWVPLLTGVAAYQLVVAGRPLLYWQERVGAKGQPFRMVKFRTMRRDAEDDGRGPRLAEHDDARIIPACRWVRRTRLDELPQILNVLRGEMSLVGPRPERPELTAAFERVIPGYGRRHAIPPGLTGLAQVHGRYHTDAEYKLGYDLQYVVNWSPVLDVQILARTLWVILTGRL